MQTGLSNQHIASSNNGLQCILKCGNGEELSGFVLSDPSVRKLDDHKIIVACTITGTFKRGTSYIPINCAIYKEGTIVKNEYLTSFTKERFSGFSIASSEIDIDINVDEIDKIVFYIG